MKGRSAEIILAIIREEYHWAWAGVLWILGLAHGFQYIMKSFGLMRWQAAFLSAKHNVVCDEDNVPVDCARPGWMFFKRSSFARGGDAKDFFWRAVTRHLQVTIARQKAVKSNLLSGPK